MPEPWLEYHTIDDWCLMRWCRLHWWPDYNHGHVAYPVDVRQYSSRTKRWDDVWIWHGPGAWLPKRPTEAEWATMRKKAKK